MMNKIFIGLCILTLVGAGVLYWLLKSLPQPADAVSKHSASEVSSQHDADNSGEHGEGAEKSEDSSAVLSEHNSSVGHEDGAAAKSAEHSAAEETHAEALQEHKKDAHTEAEPHHESTKGGTVKSEHGADKLAKNEVHAGAAHQEPSKHAGHGDSVAGSDHGEKKAAEHKNGLAETKSNVGGQKNAHLTVKTSPVPANVYVDGVKKGQTPLEISLTDKPQNLKIEAAGYVTKEELAPSIKEVERNENLPMVVVLQPLTQQGLPKKKLSHVAAEATPQTSAIKKPSVVLKADSASHSSPENTPSMAEDFFRHGPQGPYWIQLKAFSPADTKLVKTFVDTAASKSKDLVIACRVNLKRKGQWTRILVGPYDSKMDAKISLEDVQRSLTGEAFVTGEQECL